MSDAVPLIDILRDAGNDRARAEWLEAVPLHFVSTAYLDIAAVLHAAGFAPGRAYLDALHAQQHATRLPDGRYPVTVVLATEAARSGMREAIRMGELHDSDMP
ncbi:hypothetical protein [Shinella sp. BYT-45]|uniref:hypothetical protein n=1 Tax=Shinella sp. BYT-45 TaxID=3377377 RepID=UPI00397F0834